MFPAALLALSCTASFGQTAKNIAQTIVTPYGTVELIRSIDESAAVIQDGAQRRLPEYGPADTLDVDNTTMLHEWGTILSFEKRFDYPGRCVLLFSVAGGESFSSTRYFFVVMRKGAKPLLVSDPELKSDDGTMKARRAGSVIKLDLGFFHSRGENAYHRFARLQGTRLTVTTKPRSIRPPAGYEKKAVFDIERYACRNLPRLAMNDKHWDYYADGACCPGKLILNINVKDYARQATEIYKGRVLVKAPDRTVSSKKFDIPNDGTYVAIEYPGAFKGPRPLMTGVYTVLWEVEGGLVGCNGFQVRDNDTRIKPYDFSEPAGLAHDAGSPDDAS